ncbi:glycosyltransferase family 4 protein [Streptomyces sp. NPDC018007]|uniref:glycosyltransferase family 4 protein n=1 Tax=Streptomyces sp. NPDC018007 TaxID=3365029 RepID=UPI0037A24E0A
MSQLRTVQVLGGGSAGSSAHVGSLTAGLVARGVRVTVCAPPPVESAHRFTAAGARFLPVPRRSDPAAVAALRAACAGADVVHAHGLHAAARTALALSGRPVPLVVTWHTRRYAEGARRQILHLLERRAARAATVVLAPTSDLVDLARERGARDARIAPLAVLPPPPADTGAEPHKDKLRAELGAVERPLLMAVGDLVPQQGFSVLLDAVRLWRGLDPEPLLVVAGEGSDREALRRRIREEELPVRIVEPRDGTGELIAAADLALLPSRWEGRSLPAQEALRAGVPLVATAVGGTPELVGEAAELVPYGDAEALARAVVRLVEDPAERARLAEAGRAQAADWPTQDDTTAHVLSVYDELAQP